MNAGKLLYIVAVDIDYDSLWTPVGCQTVVSILSSHYTYHGLYISVSLRKRPFVQYPFRPCYERTCVIYCAANNKIDQTPYGPANQNDNSYRNMRE